MRNELEKLDRISDKLKPFGTFYLKKYADSSFFEVSNLKNGRRKVDYSYFG